MGPIDKFHLRYGLSFSLNGHSQRIHSSWMVIVLGLIDNGLIFEALNMTSQFFSRWAVRAWSEERSAQAKLWSLRVSKVHPVIKLQYFIIGYFITIYMCHAPPGREQSWLSTVSCSIAIPFCSNWSSRLLAAFLLPSYNLVRVIFSKPSFLIMCTQIFSYLFLIVSSNFFVSSFPL